MDTSTTQNTIWNRSWESTAPLLVAIMANTIDAAPRSPAHAVRSCCCGFARSGVRIKATANGLATKVRNTAIRSPGTQTARILDGKDRRPSIKKMNICIRLVSPSKKLTSTFLWLTLRFPSIIPIRYALRYPFPPIADGSA